MSSPPEFETLKAKLAEVHDLAKTASLLSWDQQTIMPPGGAEVRSAGCFSDRLAIAPLPWLPRSEGASERPAYPATRVKYSPVRVSMRRTSPSLMKSGTFTT